MMKETLDGYRDNHREFTTDVNDELGLDPFKVFDEWFDIAANGEDREANAFALSTSSLEHQASSRIVYLKGIIENKFIFYSNYESQKGKEITANPKVSMLFFWPLLSKQIRIEGICTKTSAHVSDSYFESRPRGSKIGAWASHQSDELQSRDDLEGRLQTYDAKFKETVPRPEYWGGFQIKPELFEFWSGRKSRLHERLIFKNNDGTWNRSYKNP
jgi:pyridoxamine 5'-phosphate oxidase